MTTYNITENGNALAHIVIAAGAKDPIPYAAEELAYHIKKVSGATVPVVHEEAEGSLPILIGTPETLPELETLFQEDLAWLRTLSENGKKWGSDGFAIRLHEGKLYIFGAVARGALNGVYDFIEKNTGLIWARAVEDYGTIYTEMPTIPAKTVNYREKSPFEVRAWHACSSIELNCILFSRNKINTVSCPSRPHLGLGVLSVSHNVKNLVKQSPVYDPAETEYWNTGEDGTPCTYETSVQINFFSDKTAEAVAASIIAQLDAGETHPFIGIEDKESFGWNRPHDTERFEYAPGCFVSADEEEYQSTVYFTFVNKVARRVKEARPGGRIDTFAYLFTEQTPLCDVEDNVRVIMAPIGEELTYALDDPRSEYNKKIFSNMEGWRKKGVEMVFYNYYGCFKNGDYYTRPIWDRLKEHLTYYRDCCFTGLIPEGVGDDGSSYCWYHDHTENIWWNLPFEPAKADSNHYFWAMNGMTCWIYEKLAWNPDLDVDALIVEFCDKVYGEASSAMQEYYCLIKLGWDRGRYDMPCRYEWFTPEELHEDCFLFNPKFEEDPETKDLMKRILAALNTAWEQGDDRARENIRLVKERMEKISAEYVYAPRTPYGQW